MEFGVDLLWNADRNVFICNKRLPWACNKIEDLPSIIRKQPVKFKVDLDISDDSKDFIIKCLRYKEELRMNYENILDHPLLVYIFYLSKRK